MRIPGYRIGESDECWPWLGSRTVNGYGRLGNRYAHRLVYEQEVGPIPDGLNVLHSCDNPPCVNPRHLRVGTQADNARDALERGRLNTTGLQRRGEWTHCKRGHPLDESNTYRDPSGGRECQTCKRERLRLWKEARRAATR
jgi:hypothetical protein